MSLRNLYLREKWKYRKQACGIFFKGFCIDNDVHWIYASIGLLLPQFFSSSLKINLDYLISLDETCYKNTIIFLTSTPMFHLYKNSFKNLLIWYVWVFPLFKTWMETTHNHLWTHWSKNKARFHISYELHRCWSIIYITDSHCLPPTGIPEMVQILGSLKRPTYRHQSSQQCTFISFQC